MGAQLPRYSLPTELLRLHMGAQLPMQLLASPQTQAAVAGLHTCASLATSLFAPFAPPGLAGKQ